jgi:hypothetical protein
VGRLTRVSVGAACALTPALLLVVAMVGWLGAAIFGAHPFWPIERLTLSEAAALQDGGEVARLLAEGQDPNARYTVRAGLLEGGAGLFTPVEAAVAANRAEILAILVHAGAAPPVREGGESR